MSPFPFKLFSIANSTLYKNSSYSFAIVYDAQLKNQLAWLRTELLIVIQSIPYYTLEKNLSIWSKFLQHSPMPLPTSDTRTRTSNSHTRLQRHALAIRYLWNTCEVLWRCQSHAPQRIKDVQLSLSGCTTEEERLHDIYIHTNI